MDLSVGDRVVYPYHGVAEVTSISARTVNGHEQIYVQFSVEPRTLSGHRTMSVSVPIDLVDEVGVREVATRETADDVLEVLAVTDVRVPSNWSRRFKNHQEKLKTGDLFQYAEVVRNLARRQQTTTLAAAERAMYGTARHLLSTELAVTWSVTTDAAEARVDEAINGAVTSSGPA